MKTLKELADEYADKKHNYNPNFPRDVQHNYDVWWDSHEDFLAGYKAAQETYKVAIEAFEEVAQQMMDEAVRLTSSNDQEEI